MQQLEWTLAGLSFDSCLNQTHQLHRNLVYVAKAFGLEHAGQIGDVIFMVADTIDQKRALSNVDVLQSSYRIHEITFNLERSFRISNDSPSSSSDFH